MDEPEFRPSETISPVPAASSANKTRARERARWKRFCKCAADTINHPRRDLWE